MIISTYSQPDFLCFLSSESLLRTFECPANITAMMSRHLCITLILNLWLIGVMDDINTGYERLAELQVSKS